MRKLVPIAMLAGLALAACSSDDFGEVGASLPLDVSQDELLTEAPPISFAQALPIDGQTNEPYHERQTIFLGSRDVGGFRASPVFEFELDDASLRAALRSRLRDSALGLTTAYVDSYTAAVEFDFDFVLAAAIDLELFEREKAVAPDEPQKSLKTIDVYETAAPITEDDATSDAIALLLAGTPFTQFEQTTATSNWGIPVPRERAVAWIEDDDGTGVALFDATPDDIEFASSVESNFIAFAGNGFTRSGSQLESNLIGETVSPELILTLDAVGPGEIPLSDIRIGMPAELAFTVIERTAAGTTDPVLAAHTVSRVWLQPDLTGLAELPSDATVNRAFLTVFRDSTNTLITRNRDVTAEASDGELTSDSVQDLSVFAVEATLGEADRVRPLFSLDAQTPPLRRIGDTRFAALQSDSVRVDVTRYVQRYVNGVVDPATTGILLVLGTEILDYDLVTFFGPDAADMGRRPRLTVTYTPPADTWN